MTSTPAIEARPAAVSTLAGVDTATRDLLLKAGLVAGVVELASLRIFTRTAIHIPALEPLRQPYEVVSSLARYAFFVSVLLLGMNLFVFAWGHLGAAQGTARLGAGLASSFLAIASAARAGLLEGVALDATVSAVVVAAAAIAAATRHGLQRAVLALLAAAHAASSAHTIMQDGAGYGWRMDSTGSLLFAAETATLVAVIAAGAAWGRRPARRDAIVGVAAATLVLGALVANGSTVKILLLWNFGLAGYFPPVVYALAAGALALLLTGARRGAGAGDLGPLALLLLAGIGLHSTYQSGLALLGFLLLASHAREARGVRGQTA